jgi:hypothetical protein
VTRLESDQFLQGEQLRRTVHLASISQVRTDLLLEDRQSGRMPFAKKSGVEVFFGARSTELRGIRHEGPLLHVVSEAKSEQLRCARDKLARKFINQLRKSFCATAYPLVMNAFHQGSDGEKIATTCRVACGPFTRLAPRN